MSDWIDAEQHVERAHEAYEAGKWDEAVSHLRQALSFNPYRAEWHFNLGLTLEAAGRLEDARLAFAEAQALEPRDYHTLLMLGVSSLRLDDAKTAVKWLEGAQQTEPDKAEPFVYRIEAYTRLGDHEQAEHMFYRSLQLEGDHALAFANIAESLIERGEYERAASCLKQAAALDPDLPRVHARLAAAHGELGRHEQARQLYLRELRRAPGDIDTLLDLGCLLVDMSRFAEASEKFRRVLEIESDHPDAHFYLGDLAMRQHRSKEALAAFRLVLRLDPEHPEVLLRLARLSLREGEVGEARKLLRRELRRFRSAEREFTEDDLEELGHLLLDARLPREATPVFASLVERDPDDPESLQALAVAHFQSGDRSLGMDASRRVLRLRPDHVPALHNMALACLHERQWGKARHYLEHALRLEPDDHALRRLRLTLRVHRAGESLRWLLRRRRPVRFG